METLARVRGERLDRNWQIEISVNTAYYENIFRELNISNNLSHTHMRSYTHTHTNAHSGH